MNNERFSLYAGNTTMTYEVSSRGDEVPFIGPTLDIRYTSLGHIMNSSSIQTDTRSLRKLGQYLIDKADEFDKIPSTMTREYVHKATHYNFPLSGDGDTYDQDS